MVAEFSMAPLSLRPGASIHLFRFTSLLAQFLRESAPYKRFERGLPKLLKVGDRIITIVKFSSVF